MAAIIDDGPHAWVIDTLNRKLGRLYAAATSAACLVAVFVIDPGLARQICAVGAIVLAVGAAWPPHHPASVKDLAQLEELVMASRVRDQAIVDRVDGITEAVADIRKAQGL